MLLRHLLYLVNLLIQWLILSNFSQKLSCELFFKFINHDLLLFLGEIGYIANIISFELLVNQ